MSVGKGSIKRVSNKTAVAKGEDEKEALEPSLMIENKPSILNSSIESHDELKNDSKSNGVKIYQISDELPSYLL